MTTRLSASLLRILVVALVPANLAAQATVPKFNGLSMLDVKRLSLADLSNDGRWLAITTSTERRHLGPTRERFWGDPSMPRSDGSALEVIDTRSGAVVQPVASTENVLAAKWSPEGTRLAFVMKRGDDWVPVVWDRASGRVSDIPLPSDRVLAVGGALARVAWSPDGREVILILQTRAWQQRVRQRFQHLVSGAIVVMSSAEPFLPWEAQEREGGRYSAVALDVATKRVRELLPEAIYSSYMPPSVSDDGLRLAYEIDTLTRTPYGPTWRTAKRAVIPFVASGERRTLAERQIALDSARRATLLWARDGRRYAYAKDGRVLVGALDGPERQIAGPPPSEAGATRDTTKPKPRPEELFTITRFAAAGDWLLVSNSRGLWDLDASTGTRVPVSAADTVPGGRQITFLSENTDGSLILGVSARTAWKTGIYRYEHAGRRLTQLIEDSRRFGQFGIEARVTPDGKIITFSAAEGSVPSDLYVMDGDGENVRRLTHANPAFDDPRVRKTELMTYLDSDGRRQYGVIYFPFDYAAGRAYPTIVHPYEQFFVDEYEPTDKVLNANGYVVVRPSVPTKEHPGSPTDAWMKGVTIALNQLIDRGLTDSSRIGVYGCSYGGYATNLLITQSPRFKAAVNIAGLSDLVSMYTDSPRLGLRNMYFSESTTGQFPMTGTLWQVPQKYIQNSPLFYFDRVNAAVLIVSGSEDHNVIPGQQQEAFYALRRLGKTVDWVTYRNMGHCLPDVSEETVADFHSRVVGWFDRFVKR